MVDVALLRLPHARDLSLPAYQSEGAAGLERREGRAEADRPGDAVEHHVGGYLAHEGRRLLRAHRGVLDVELVGLRLHWQRRLRWCRLNLTLFGESGESKLSFLTPP